MTRRRELREEQKTEIVNVFEFYDPSNTGTVEKRHLKAMMRNLSHNVKKEQLNRLFVQCGISTRANRLSYNEFYNLMEKVMNEKNIQEETMRAFNLFDIDGTGKITIDNLKTVSRQLGEKMTDSELKEMITEADTDGDGAVDATEFVRIMKKSELW